MKKTIIMGALAGLSFFSPGMKAQNIEKNAQQNISKNIVQDNYKTLLNTPVSNLSISQLRTTMLKYINEIRKENNLKSMFVDSQVNIVAQKYSTYLYENNMDSTIEYEDHTDKEGNMIGDRLEKAGIELDPDCWGECYSFGENLVSADGTVKELVDAWMDSPPHKKMLLCKDYTHAGIGHSAGSNNVVLVAIRKPQ